MAPSSKEEAGDLGTSTGDAGIRHELRLAQSLPALPLTQQSLILRVSQEALTNVHKHGAATDDEIALVGFDATTGVLSVLADYLAPSRRFARHLRPDTIA